jgi:hypothetical protein
MKMEIPSKQCKIKKEHVKNHWFLMPECMYWKQTICVQDYRCVKGCKAQIDLIIEDQII